MKWVSLVFALLGALSLGVSGHFWQQTLDSPEFHFIFFVSQVHIGGAPSEASAAASHSASFGLMFLRAIPSCSYAGMLLSLAGAALVVTKGRVAALPLLLASVLLLLPLGWVVASIPELSAFLYAVLVGFPSLVAGLAALPVQGKPRAASPQVAELQLADPAGAEEKSSPKRKKQIWIGAGSMAALLVLLLIWVGLSGKAAADEDELLFHPGPVALWSNDLFELGSGPLQLNRMVAAEWDGSWYAARVLSTNQDSARIRFVGWESSWDEDVPRERLRSLPDELVPRRPPDSQSAGAALGTGSATPCAFMVSLYQPEAGLAEGAKLSDLTPKQTLYSPRLDLSDVPLERALAGSAIQAGKPFAISAVGTLRVKDAGQHYFATAANGATRLWIDDQPVSADSPVQLDAGAHDLRVEHRHDTGSTMTLQLRIGTKPGALRTLDLNRDGVAQFAAEQGGGLRLVLDEGLLFDLDRAELKPSAERALSSIYARSIAPVPTSPIGIEGHTDSTGTAEHNLDLSRRRAESVRDWLTTRGRATGLRVASYGETRPRVPNDTDQHRRLNRRVELVIGASDPGGEATRTPASREVPVAPAAAPPAAALPTSAAISAAGSGNQAVLSVLHSYYSELNDGSFDANRYFEPAVERYITMMNTSTGAMNNYIRNILPKQFKQFHFELEEGSLSQESPGQYVYVEHSRYIQAGKQASVERRVKVRIRVSSSGKLVFLHQFQRL